jgi:hypothetical protein
MYVRGTRSAYISKVHVATLSGYLSLKVDVSCGRSIWRVLFGRGAVLVCLPATHHHEKVYYKQCSG